MSNDKTRVSDNAFIAPANLGRLDIRRPSEADILAHEVPHGDVLGSEDLNRMKFFGLDTSHYDGDNLYYDSETGFHGQVGGQLIDGFLAPVHIFTEARALHDAVFQAESGAVIHCGNHALVAQGQHLAGVWQKSGIEFKLVPEPWRIAEPETYADIRKD